MPLKVTNNASSKDAIIYRIGELPPLFLVSPDQSGLYPQRRKGARGRLNFTLRLCALLRGDML